MERKDRFLEIGSSSSPASSPSLKRKRGSGDESPEVDFDHDVFISFRGEDTRTNFTSHVYDALCRKQIKAFIDSEDLRKGHEVRGSLLKAIEMSKVYLIIFSPDYGSSRWCLMELEKIFQCSKQPHGKKMVIPVFYKVEPTHVRHQTGSFENAFIEHEAEEEKEKVLKWRVALKEVAGLSGFPLKEHMLETEFINEIVAAILKEFPLPTPSEDFVGIDPYIENVLYFLSVDSSEVRSVGIWGMGGIGKTTIAKAVCHRIDHAQFDGYYFLQNVREKIKRIGVDAFWNSVLSEILGIEECFTQNLRLSSVKQRLRRKSVLIIFDDVDESIFLELEDLRKHHDLFGVGSKILMTSRDRHVLTKFLVDEVCEVGGLQREEALKLFSLKAFQKESPPVEYVELSNRVVRYTQGNPLALTVLGLDLLDRDREYWDGALHKMNIFPQSILNLLRISYDGLLRKEKDVFLDIACFFKGENLDHVRNLYESAHPIIIRLIDKCLITISQQKSIELHDLVQEMGWKMDDDEEEVTDDPGKRKRLHKSDDIYRVLTGKNVATGAIQGISLNLSEVKTMNFGVDAFAGMVNLRWLKVYGQNDQVCLLNAPRMRRSWWDIFGTNYEVFLPQMKYLYWEAFPLQSLSSTFNVQNLVKLHLPRSKVERLWSGVQDVVNLRWMDLSQSPNLIETPDLSKAKNLESMNVEWCRKLTRLHPSVQYLKKLQVLHLCSCSNLSEIPSVLESEVLKEFTLQFCKKIKEWPKFYGNKLEIVSLTASEMNEESDFSGFQCLQDLRLHTCPNMTKFPEMPRASSLGGLLICGTGVEEIPSSIQFLTGLHRLLLMKNCKLRSISDSISRLKSLSLLCIWECKLLSFIPVLPTSLVNLEVADCPSLETVSPISSQSQLRVLYSLGCGKLDHQSLTNIMGHISFKAKLQRRMAFLAVIQGSEIPDWFPHENVRVGSSVTLPILPSNLHDGSRGFVLSYVLEANPLYIDCQNNFSLKLEARAHPQTDDQDLPPAVAKIDVVRLFSHLNFFLYNITRPHSDLVVLWSTATPSQFFGEMLSPKYSSISFQFTPLLPQLKDVVNLRWMDLSDSHNLTETPDLSKAKKLESMVFEYCKKLTRIHPSVQYLKKLLLDFGQRD